jgi:hypothetical protein
MGATSPDKRDSSRVEHAESEGLHFERVRELEAVSPHQLDKSVRVQHACRRVLRPSDVSTSCISSAYESGHCRQGRAWNDTSTGRGGFVHYEIRGTHTVSITERASDFDFLEGDPSHSLI